MQASNLSLRRPVNRRHFLRGTGAAILALPLLEAMGPTLGQSILAAGTDQNQSPKRFVAMCATLGFHAPHLFPDKEGKDYQLTPYLNKIASHRNDFTLFSSLSHPNQQGNSGHASGLTWLTSAPRPGLVGFRNTISIDQLIAEKIGIQTRYPYLALSTTGQSMSWNSAGVEIPGQASPAKLFKMLFVNGSQQENVAEIQGLKRGHSILDTIGEEAKKLHQRISQQDREKLDEYLIAVRDLESRLQESQNWVTRPKPTVDAKVPQDINDRNEAIARQKLMYDMIILALQTDSTRTITFQLGGLNSVPIIKGVKNDWHGLSHHGKDPQKIDELKLIEEAEFEAFDYFLTKMKAIHENGKSLLDNTAVLFGSNLGNASAHSWRNLPIIVAGGGYKHGRYVAHDPESNTPFANLFVPLAQRMGVDVRNFGSSTKETIRGLELI